MNECKLTKCGYFIMCIPFEIAVKIKSKSMRIISTLLGVLIWFPIMCFIWAPIAIIGAIYDISSEM